MNSDGDQSVQARAVSARYCETRQTLLHSSALGRSSRADTFLRDPEPARRHKPKAAHCIKRQHTVNNTRAVSGPSTAFWRTRDMAQTGTAARHHQIHLSLLQTGAYIRVAEMLFTTARRRCIPDGLRDLGTSGTARLAVEVHSEEARNVRTALP